MTERESPPAKRSKTGALPVEQYKDALISTIKANQVCVVTGETGSGKSTYLPKFILDAQLVSSENQLAVTQPRRVAATSIAERVSSLVGTELGKTVGYSVRFDEKASTETAIKFLTDGKLLREFLLDRRLSSYKVIMIDEAHERSINTDVLLALLKQLLKVRTDLKLIISSATLDAAKFSAYFGCPVFKLHGSQYKVQTFYAKETQADICAASAAAVQQICDSQVGGDILVFLPGLDEISKVELELADRDLNVVCLHGQKSLVDQQTVFKPSLQRKVVLATNIAETSITVPNIVHVIDSGLVKQKQGDCLELVRCSKASADQRAGRAGRTMEGTCFRLYTRDVYELMPQFSKPEILRTSLDSTLLLLLSMQIDVFRIEFIDKWTSTNFYASLRSLYALGAVTKDAKLTKLGRLISEFPTSPQLAKFVILALDNDKLLEQATVLAVMIPEFLKYAKPIKTKLGDWGVLLNAYGSITPGSRVAKEKEQLQNLCTQLKPFARGGECKSIQELAEKAFSQNIATLNSDGSYTANGIKAFVHPRSAVSANKVVYAALVITRRPLLLCCLPLS